MHMSKAYTLINNFELPKIYLDGADRTAIIEYAKNPLVSGFTTNPTLMKKSGVTDYVGFCKEILTQVTDKPISFEVFADDEKEMLRQALIIKTWGKNVYVKIPIINTKGVSTTPLIRELTQQGVNLNITAILTLNQVLDTCQALKGGAPAVVSVFAGRISDSGRDPVPLMKAASEICRATGTQIELLWASTREVYNLIQAQESGCHIITTPADILKKAQQFGKDLFDISVDTVKMFKSDSEAAGFKL